LEIDVEKMLELGTPADRGTVGNQESGKKIDTKKTLVVGNLPYYITSPILRKFFADAGQQKFAGGLFMLQDEV
jgi:16S rRNA A1518/A1519 N6-dimethyltransferase RsmA/KsgA/DIM1 with predicted DNA glycosylase/AP lyase activity